VLGDKRTGNIAVSLCLSYNEKLSGMDIKSLLDKVFSEYDSEYIVGNNLGNAREDWSFVNNIKNEYASKLKPSDDKIQVGTIDAAVIYYKDDAELQRYFDVPFQEEYSKYKQVFFISEQLKPNPENPLNALRHSGTDLTGRIDLDNPKYTLRFNARNKDNVQIEVRENDVLRSSGNKIKRKSNLEIIWSKPYHKTKTQHGKWFEIDRQHITVNDQDQTVHVEETVLEPETRSLTLRIADINGTPTITCTSNFRPAKQVVNNRIEFTGEEIGEIWNIFVSAPNYAPEKFNYRPADHRGNNEKDIRLVEEKIVEIRVINEANGDVLSGFEVSDQQNQRRTLRSNNQIVFIGNEIEQEWRLQIKYKGYETKSTAPICPRTQQTPITVKLQRSQKLTLIERNNRQNNFDDVPVNTKTRFNIVNWLFKDILRSAMIITGLVVVAFGVLILCIYLKKKEPTKQPQYFIQQVQKYVHGTELNRDSLNRYEKKLNNQKPRIKIKTSSLWSILFGGGSRKRTTDSTEYKEWNHTLQQVKTALIVRDSIKYGNIVWLKAQSNFPSSAKFRQSLNEIDNALSIEVGSKLKAIHCLDTLNLNQIADTINAIVRNINQSGKDKKPKEQKKEAKKEETPPTPPTPPQESPKPQTLPQQKPVSSAETAQIIQYLKGNELKKTVLEQYKNENTDKKLTGSIQLCLDFWNLVKNSNQMNAFVRLLNDNIAKDQDLKNSELRKFLDVICASSDAFEKYNETGGKQLCTTLKQLKDKLEIK
jgi:hypothetical protein